MYRIPARSASPSSGGSSTADDDEDDRFSDWASSLGEARTTQSLFDEQTFSSPEEAIQHDTTVHGFNVTQVCKEIGLDTYGKIRLINCVRREKLSPNAAQALVSTGSWAKDDALLVPVIPDDPLLQLDLNDEWSDDEGLDPGPSRSAVASQKDSQVDQLERQLAQVKKELATAQQLLKSVLSEGDDASPIANGIGKGKGKAIPVRDDDTHYFDSYAENDIHEIMLKDTTRTVTYARFILSNPQIFKGAVVMDVGCGTGILSMFAARAGAKHVYAIEASGLAGKARENIRNNGLDGVITVIQSKVENVSLPVEEVNVIVSEWMGYMLLYESMLDSVLHARDRFLAPGGLMVPSHTRLMISAVSGEKLWKDRVEFWQSVYGFDMSAMDEVYFKEGLVDVADAEDIVTSDAVIRHIDSHTATPKSLDFHASFVLRVTTDATIRAFLTSFDTFFSTGANVAPGDPVDTAVVADDVRSEVRPVQPGLISFTTGPRGKETHWRQVVFLLREHLKVQPGDEIKGKFYCRKSPTNSRELDVEIHFGVNDSSSVTVQTYKVR